MATDTVTTGGKLYLQSFGDNSANRLTRAGETTSGTGTWNGGFGYDQCGNRWVSSMTPSGLEGASTPTASSNFDAKNRLLVNGAAYDPAGTGNQTAIGGYTASFDSEQRLKSSTLNSNTTNYSYDANGRRVTNTGQAGTTVYVYDVGGALAAEYSTVPNLGASTLYLTTDALGSTRLVSNGAGAIVSCHDYLPHGAEIVQTLGNRPSCYSGTDGVTQRFTGKERDAETGLDYFGARYYSGAQGRFTSPDQPFADQHVHDPQSWNLYSYARNNPLRFVDVTGEAVIESRKIQTYQVQGRTAAEAFANARQVSGFKSESGEAMSGLTFGRMGVINMRVQDSVQPGNSLVDSFATSELVSADVKLDQTITLPEWSGRANATPEEQAAWDAGLTGLKQHEDQHATINRTQAEKLDKSLPGTRGSGQAPASGDAQRKARSDFASKVQQKQQRVLDETRKRQRKLDDDTDHGRRQP